MQAVVETYERSEAQHWDEVLAAEKARHHNAMILLIIHRHADVAVV